MRLSMLLKDISFDNVFSEILKYSPESEKLWDLFLQMFEYLSLLPFIVKVRIFVEADPHLYLGDDIYYFRLYSYPKDIKVIYQYPLLMEIVEPIFDLRSFREIEPKISKEKLLALLLWDLVGRNQFNKFSTHDASFHKDEVAIDSIYEITPYNISSDRCAFRVECTLDNYMWREEERTIIYLNHSSGYEHEIEKLCEFINRMMRNPTIILGNNIIRGIAMKCKFICRSHEDDNSQNFF